jgi:hypothetical protein
MQRNFPPNLGSRYHALTLRSVGKRLVGATGPFSIFAALEETRIKKRPHHAYSSFRVKGKIFVTVPPGGEHIHAFVDYNERDRAIALYPHFVEKLLWGGKVVGLRVRLPDATPPTRTVVSLTRSARLAPRSPRNRPTSPPG